ncbi:MAG: ribosome silencing factor [Spirochaetales bacterium]
MSDRDSKRRADVLAVAELLDDAQAQDAIALNVSETCGFADYFIVATANSQGHLRGLIDQLNDLFAEREMEPMRKPKRDAEVGWVLVDLGFAVIHLMSREMRAFYELERLWFGSQQLYPAEEV